MAQPKKRLPVSCSKKYTTYFLYLFSSNAIIVHQSLIEPLFTLVLRGVIKINVKNFTDNHCIIKERKK